MATGFRDLPSVNDVLSDDRIQRLVDEFTHDTVLSLVRSEIDQARETIKNGGAAPGLDALVGEVEESASSKWHSWPTPVINATGVILHTNLGRAPLSDDAVEAMRTASKGYSDLELDLETGRRGSRQAYLNGLLCLLTGAEAALVVNNNASAVLLGLATVANSKEVIVSRGEAVEIGGGFRIPDVLRQSGATLVEIGTTNKTYVSDYEAAITENTGAILSVHASNFRVVGFTHSPDLHELVELGKHRSIPVLHDLGSGCLLDTKQFGLAHEPMPQESVDADASLAFFSGDKLLGGPQAGIIVGKTEFVNVVSKHPLARAVRIAKADMAALAATLLHYIKGEATTKIPIWSMISETAESLTERAERWRSAIGGPTSVVEGQSTIGGGSLPGEVLASSLLSLDAGAAPGGAEALAAELRRGSPPIIGRIESEQLLLDPRTVLPHQEEVLIRVVSQVLTTS